MRFHQLTLLDGALALLLGVAAIAAGASRRDALVERFSSTAVRAAPIAAAHAPAPPPPAPRRVRVITKLATGAGIFDLPAAGGPAAVKLKPGAVVDLVEPSAPPRDGWRQIQTQSGRRGWVTAESLESEAASAGAVARLEASDATAGRKVTARQRGHLHASPALAERVGGFARGEQLRVLRAEGRALLVAASDGDGGHVLGYARTTDVRGRAPARRAPPPQPPPPPPPPQPPSPVDPSPVDPYAPGASDPIGAGAGAGRASPAPRAADTERLRPRPQPEPWPEPQPRPQAEPQPELDAAPP